MFFVSAESKGLADANLVSADAKGLSEERRLELRCWKLDRETHISPWSVSTGLTGSVEPFGMRSTHILAFSLTFPDCGLSGGLRASLPSGRLAITTEVRIPQMTTDCQGLIWGGPRMESERKNLLNSLDEDCLVLVFHLHTASSTRVINCDFGTVGIGVGV